MTTFNKIYKYSRIWILLIVAILLPKWVPNRYYQGVVFSQAFRSARKGI